MAACAARRSGLVASGLRLRFREAEAAGWAVATIVFHGEIGTEIGKDQDAQSDSGFFDGELRVLQIALALLLGDLGFDDIGVRDFAALFLLLRDIEELLGFAQAGLGVGELALRRDDGVVVLNHGRVQAARGDFDLRAARRLRQPWRGESRRGGPATATPHGPGPVRYRRARRRWRRRRPRACRCLRCR